MAYSILIEEPGTLLGGISLVTPGKLRWDAIKGPSSAKGTITSTTSESQAELPRFRRRLAEWMPWKYCGTNGKEISPSI